MPNHPGLPEQFGRYRILQKLGAGGMGAVYLAQDPQLGRKVALKVPHFTADDGPAIERFQREARIAANIDHPNLCAVHEVGEVNGTHYFTMPYVEGTPLSRLIRTDKPWSPRAAAELLRQVALAVSVLHRNGIVHRDLKPSNIMVRPTGEPVLMDFGLARSYAAQTRQLTRAGSPLGTPAYMSPEQVEGDPQSIGPASDVYSLGVVLYELVTGRLPFEGPLLAVFAQILNAAPGAPSRHRPVLDGRIDALCLKAMSKKAEHRYPTASAFAAALVQYVRESGVGAAVGSTLPSAPAPEAIVPDEPRSACPRCGKLLKVPADKADRRVKCPRCRSPLKTAPIHPETAPLAPQRSEGTDENTCAVLPGSRASAAWRLILMGALGILLLGGDLIGWRIGRGEGPDKTEDDWRGAVQEDKGETSPPPPSPHSEMLVQSGAVGLAVEAFALGEIAGAGNAEAVWDWAGDHLIDWIQDPDPRVRQGAAFALGNCGKFARPALPALTEALRDEEAPVRDASAFALSEVAAGSPENGADVWERAGKVLLERLRDADPGTRWGAALALRKCGAAALPAVPALSQMLRDRDNAPAMRRKVAWVLGKLGTVARSRAAVDALVAALQRGGEDALVLCAVAEALGEVGPAAASAVKALVAVFRDNRNSNVRKAALRTLVCLIGPEAAQTPVAENTFLVEALRGALTDADAETKELAAAALANLGERAAPALSELAALLGDEDALPATRRNAALALTKLAKDIRESKESIKVVGKLARALNPKTPVEVRRFAAETLARIGFPAAEPALEPLLNAIRKDPDVTVRQRAGWAFLNADPLPAGAKEALLDALKDRDRALRYDAARGLAQALRQDSPKEVIDALEEMLNDKEILIYRQTNANVRGGSESTSGQSTVKADISGDARYMAAQALGYIGPKANRPTIIKTLKELKQSKDALVAKHSKEALEAIDK